MRVAIRLDGLRRVGLDAHLADGPADGRPVERAGAQQQLGRAAQTGHQAATADDQQVEPTVAIDGPVGEGVLYIYGRKDVAAVSLDGPLDAVAQVVAAPFGL